MPLKNLETAMTITLNPQYVIDKKQKTKAVLLSIEEWEEVLDALEELDDIHAYDAAKSGDLNSIPFDQAVREIEAGYL
jgi:PHD/YefM family antitoxin component YafN of YafNO toxin-antitoxin module